MKKLFLLALAFCLLVSFAAGEDVDLSGLSFEQLVSLKDRINLAIWNSQDWQEVTVPQGVWIVGEDIPAGKWTVKCADEGIDTYTLECTKIIWGSSFDKASNRIPFRAQYGEMDVYNPASKFYKNEMTELTLDLAEGTVVVVYDHYNKAVFTPYAGKPDLGFK